MSVLGGSAQGARLPSGGGQRRELRVGVIGVHMQLVLAQLVRLERSGHDDERAWFGCGLRGEGVGRS